MPEEENKKYYHRINNLYEDIEYEYSGTNYLKSLEEYYREVDEENE